MARRLGWAKQKEGCKQQQMEDPAAAVWDGAKGNHSAAGRGGEKKEMEVPASQGSQ